MGLLVVLTVGVVAGLMAALLLVMRDASAAAEDAEHTETIAAVTDVSLELVLSLQLERGYSMGYVLSDGEQFGPELSGSRVGTDEALEQAALQWSELRDDVDAATRERLDPALDLDEELTRLRADIDALADERAPLEAINETSSAWAEPIQVLTSAFADISSAQGDADTLRQRVALAHLARAVRAAGNERSLLIAAFTADEPLTIEQIEAIHARRALVTESLERFAELASSEQRAAYAEMARSPSFVETEEAIDLALARRDRGDYGVDPAAVFVTATERVELMAELARAVNEDLGAAARQQADDARSTLRSLTAAAVLIVILAALFGIAAASSIRHRRRAEQEVRGVAHTLQRSLLPDRLPSVDRVELYTRYEASAEHARVGGDWYDALVLPNGRLGLMIGDVVGHGIQAAALMGEVRHALRAIAFRDESPEEVLRQLARLLGELHPSGEVMATVVYAVLDPASGVLRYANAGHPPPLWRTPDGRVQVLDHPRSVLVGTHFHSDYQCGEVLLEPGSLVLLYTDGLVERPGEHLDRSTSRLAESLGQDVDDLARLADRLYDELIEEPGPTDDLAVLLVRYLGPASDGAVDRARVASDVGAHRATQLAEDRPQPS